MGILCDYLYIIKINETKIFHHDNPYKINITNYFDVLSSKEFYNLFINNIIPVYNNKEVKEIIGISFILDNRIGQNYFKKFEDLKFMNFRDSYEIIKNNKNQKKNENQLIVSFVIFNNILEIKKQFEINLCQNDYIIFYKHLWDINYIFKINYYKKNQLILLFLFENAYLINLKENEITSIFVIENKKTSLYMYDDSRIRKYNEIEQIIIENIPFNENIIEEYYFRLKDFYKDLEKLLTFPLQK